MTRLRLFRVALPVALSIIAISTALADDWPCWRGELLCYDVRGAE